RHFDFHLLMLKRMKGGIRTYGFIVTAALGRRIILVGLLVLWFGDREGSAQDLEQLTSARAFDVSGSVETRAVFYNANGISHRYLPFNYLVSGSPVFSLYGVDITVYFRLSRQQNAFTQPFNQFGLSPHYKWVTVHAGYRNLHYSSF